MLIGLCCYNNVLAIWGHSRWKLTFTQIVSSSLSFVLTAILNSQAGCRCALVPRLPFPVPRSPFLVLVTLHCTVCGSACLGLFCHCAIILYYYIVLLYHTTYIIYCVIISYCLPYTLSKKSTSKANLYYNKELQTLPARSISY